MYLSDESRRSGAVLPSHLMSISQTSSHDRITSRVLVLKGDRWLCIAVTTEIKVVAILALLTSAHYRLEALVTLM
jgi:hypothetical protein